MDIRVFGARCVVAEEKLEATTASGIVIPGRDKEQTNIGTVLVVGDGALLDNGTKVPMFVKPGDRVVYASFAGTPIVSKDTDEHLIVLNERDILCCID